ncbi:non-specific lipid transfer protein GPI-anchored 16 isoform X1 [Lactuca sativa]|uniref:Bifunctional inhibitor/plant lipid transfer protein/seed storage helical domain-containing protein n=1 Tax=Lactuca sativa TaxID=4236 RepID=A0A9R1UJJ9_LACSA|nr:non-specific lipid transfer protein GPI-anchored 16 isoform X1 [Lactuca sativa]KAJ0188476.1 hypothetical protein LSAT_V11C900457850 [Lactuca sativa]
MERVTCLLAITLALSVITVNSQISTPCSVSMLATFSPCVNFITGSSANGGSPTAGCCSAVESLMTTSSECMCLIVTGNVPVTLPSAINQALAITLPRVCNSKSVPLQCKSTGVPLPPAGPALFVPPPPPRALPPAADSPDIPPGPSGSSVTSSLAPSPSDTTSDDLDARDLPGAPPASAPAARKGQTVGSGIRPVLTPAASSSNPPLMVSQPVLLLTVAAIAVTNFREVFIFRFIL